MRAPVWAVQMAARFWQQAGEEEAFPRRLRGAIARAVPLSIVEIPQLCVHAVLQWLSRNQVACVLQGPNRPLRACLVARNGKGFAFIDGTDDENEQRFSLAHELAHFLRDYEHPRKRVQDAMGTSALAVFDGLRPANADERFDALLGAVALDSHVHLLDRTERGALASEAIAESEECADRLAYELLAPVARLSEICTKNSQDMTKNTLAERLQTDFGFPARQAERYAALLFPEPRRDPWILSLRKATQK